MNPLTNVRNIQNLNKRELDLGIPFAQSWHQQYRESAWIFIGGLDYDLTEGDIICLFSQYGEVVNINLIRDQKTGKSKGFAFLCYENQRSTVLSVDNLNSIKLCGRTIRVDHVEEYKVPKMKEDMAPEKMKLALEGCAPQLQPPPQTRCAGDRNTTAQSVKREENRGRSPESSDFTSDVKTEPSHSDDVVLPPRLFNIEVKEEDGAAVKNKIKDKKNKKSKKSKKKKSKSKKSKKSKNSSSSSSSSDSEENLKSDSKLESVRDRSSKKKLDGVRGESSGGSSIPGRRVDHSSADGTDTARVKEETRHRGYGSRRENGGNRSSSDSSNVEEEPRGMGYVGVGGGNNRGSSANYSRVCVKDEPCSDSSDSDEGRERKSRGHSRQVLERGTREQGRLGSSRYRRDNDHSNVNGDRKRKWDEDESGSRSKYDDKYDRHSNHYRRNAIADGSYTNSSRDTSSNREFNNFKRDTSSDKGYDKLRR